MKFLKKVTFFALTICMCFVLSGNSSVTASAASNPAVASTSSSKNSTTTKNASKKATKSYSETSAWKTTSDTSVVTSATSKKETIKETIVQKRTVTTYTKGKKAYTVKTTTKTTVKTYTYDLTFATVAPKASSTVKSAWNTLGFKFYVDPNESGSCYYSSKNRTITIAQDTFSDNNAVYTSIGFFVAFVSGNTDTSSSFKAVYNAEKSLYTAYNKASVTSTAQNYFAQSYADYVLSGSSLKSSRPKTYAAIKDALDKITTAQVNKIAKIL